MSVLAASGPSAHSSVARALSLTHRHDEGYTCRTRLDQTDGLTEQGFLEASCSPVHAHAPDIAPMHVRAQIRAPHYCVMTATAPRHAGPSMMRSKLLPSTLSCNRSRRCVPCATSLHVPHVCAADADERPHKTSARVHGARSPQEPRTCSPWHIPPPPPPPTHTHTRTSKCEDSPEERGTARHDDTSGVCCACMCCALMCICVVRVCARALRVVGRGAWLVLTVCMPRQPDRLWLAVRAFSCLFLRTLDSDMCVRTSVCVCACARVLVGSCCVLVRVTL